MDPETNEALPQIVSHEKYVRDHYLEMGKKLLSGEINPEEFAKQQTEIHLKLEAMSDYDGLIPNFLNIKGFENAVERQIALDKRDKTPSVILALDIDHLRHFNNTLGHPAGDKLIKTYGEILERLTRESDLRARLGGDEFGVYLVGTEIESAEEIAERIRKEITEQVAKTFTKEKYPLLDWEQTISIGVAKIRQEDNTLEARKRADVALYEAKKTRNATVIFDPEKMPEEMPRQ